MKKINNAEIAKRICENEEIASRYTFGEILYIVNLSRNIEEKFNKLVNKFNDVQNYELIGHCDNYCQTIDRNQAVDDAGKAVYKKYRLINFKTGDEESITAKQMEEFAKTW